MPKESKTKPVAAGLLARAWPPAPQQRLTPPPQEARRRRLQPRPLSHLVDERAHQAPDVAWQPSA
eukprot:2483834-Pyramimonas_sp.AAC.1